MRFGEIDVAEAEGAILAHTHRLESGVMKKGRRLSAADVAALTQAGLTRVVGARLDPDDVPEDDAARTVAQALAGAQITVAPASTGRVNLFASVRGVLGFDPERVFRINTIDPAITLATVSPYTVVEAGDMVATVKIIPFAVPRPALEAVLRTEPRWLSVSPLVPHRVALIQTRNPEMHDLQLDRSADSQRARVTHLGSTLIREVRCAHAEAAVTAAITEALEHGAELILALGASATCDARDVIPGAVTRLGGRIECVGMPVDPGNLLFLGRTRDVTVIGVPGCARSLKRSGFDLVLERVVARIPTTGFDLARMGSGGLLTEIEQRPWPRRGKPAAEDPT